MIRGAVEYKPSLPPFETVLGFEFHLISLFLCLGQFISKSLQQTISCGFASTNRLDLLQVFAFLIPPNLTYMQSL